MGSVHEPGLNRVDAEGTPRGVILMLHGGQPQSHNPVDGRSLSWRRSEIMQRSVARRARREGVSTWLVRYRHRGWNDLTAPSPVADARWALDRVRREHGRVPVVLLGHSMGARAAVSAADDEDVVGVVALAPWLPGGEPVRPLAGKRLAVAHGRRDRVTSYQLAREFARRADGVARTVEFVDLGDVGHYMLRSLPAWNRFAVTRSLTFLAE
jgi:pimeloyl-ACP methyl ester carboxylesterase